MAIERGKASKIRESMVRRHPAWEADDLIWEYLESLEDELIARDERIDQLETEAARLDEELFDLKLSLEDKPGQIPPPSDPYGEKADQALQQLDEFIKELEKTEKVTYGY